MPVWEPRTERVDVRSVAAENELLGPLILPDNCRVPASVGESFARFSRRSSNRASRTCAADRPALPLTANERDCPVKIIRSTVSFSSVSAVESCRRERPRSRPTQAAVPPSMLASASALRVITFSARATCAFMLASPRTTCPASAAKGARLGSRSSSCALCFPAVMACAWRANRRCVAVSSSGRVASLRRTEASIVSGASCSSFGCGPGIVSPSMAARAVSIPPAAVRSALSAVSFVPPGSCSCSASKCPSAVGVLNVPRHRPCIATCCHDSSGEGVIADASSA